jgi:hypothetical protein
MRSVAGTALADVDPDDFGGHSVACGAASPPRCPRPARMPRASRPICATAAFRRPSATSGGPMREWPTRWRRRIGATRRQDLRSAGASSVLKRNSIDLNDLINANVSHGQSGQLSSTAPTRYVNLRRLESFRSPKSTFSTSDNPSHCFVSL